MDEARIHILPEHVANQIAAGEVVQRPESVVKELVENALDAGAHSVAVFVREGGKAIIHVLDDGCGMGRADLELALQRHATSKIRTLEDLHAIQTLGFRGEALAAIASVADVEILTRRASDSHGWRLVSRPLKGQTIEPAECPAGTQVIVRNLFFTVPARKKFLRSDTTELRYISETMLRYSLSYPTHAWKFHDGGDVVFDVPPQPLLERIEHLFGEDVAASLIPVDYESELVRIEGYLGLPSLARTTKASQYLFLNHRPIVNRALTHAIYQGYEHMLEKSEHPFFILSMWIDPKRVDVNVHPQKLEVKFDDERALYHAMLEAVLGSMRQHNLIPQFRVQESIATAPFAVVQEPSAKQPLVVNRITGEIVQPDTQFPTALSSSSSSIRPQAFTSRLQSRASATVTAPAQLPLSQHSVGAEAPRIWQMHNKYILVQTDDGIMIIDQHVAHERILYESALDAMEKAAENRTQQLMFPVPLRLSARELSIYRELENDLHRLGYECRLLEESSVVEITGVPVEIRLGKEAESLREVLEQYAEYQTIRPSTARDNLAASFACRAAIKAGDPLTVQEMQQLVAELFQCRTPEVCPHGRPVMIHFPLQELDRRFGRTS
ncbi:MAG: DNA mismatch repair endonuclease MutL [Candidatus Kapabacteria bacterium]|nr:DNA mismatch repair endonuclease MutL [Candidatus Kapabacteria bacterium]